MAEPLRPDEERIAASLARAGLAPRAARAFAALARGPHGIVDLAAILGTSRQEAGLAARELEARRLVRAEDVATGGRPAKRYRLVGSPGEALRPLLAARRAALDEERAALAQIEARFGG